MNKLVLLCTLGLIPLCTYAQCETTQTQMVSITFYSVDNSLPTLGANATNVVYNFVNIAPTTTVINGINAQQVCDLLSNTHTSKCNTVLDVANTARIAGYAAYSGINNESVFTVKNPTNHNSVNVMVLGKITQ